MFSKVEFMRGVIVLVLVIATIANAPKPPRVALGVLWCFLTLLVILSGFFEERKKEKGKD